MTADLRSRLPALALVILGSIAVAPSARAFCVYNDTDLKLEFEVDTDGSGGNAPFRRNIRAGSHACCDWDQRRCDRSGHAEQPLKFGAKRAVGMMEWTCYTQGRANADMHLVSHGGASGCAWRDGSPSPGGGTGIWGAILNTLLDLLWNSPESKG
jgi:hypothetical protein